MLRQIILYFVPGGHRPNENMKQGPTLWVTVGRTQCQVELIGRSLSCELDETARVPCNAITSDCMSDSPDG